MAILTLTNGASNELAVVKLTPVEEECFTLYEYNIDTNNGDSIDIEITGNHFDAKYFDKNGNSVSFSDTASLLFDEFLKVRFLLLNSGTLGVFSNATIKITNTSNNKYYENFVSREVDDANCYKADIDLSDYLPLGGGTMNGNIQMDDNNIFIREQFFQDCNGNNKVSLLSCNPSRGIFEIYDVTNLNTSLNLGNDGKWRIGGNEILTELSIDGSETKVIAGSNVLVTGNGTISTPYIISSTGGGGGSVLFDLVPTDGSANAVHSNGIFDALQLKANDNEVVKLTSNQSILGTKSFKDLTIFENTGILLNNTLLSSPNSSPLISFSNHSGLFTHNSGFNRLGFLNGKLIFSKEGDIINDKRTQFETNPSGINNVIWQDKSGTVAFLDDIPTGTGSGNTNLTYTQSPNNGIVNSDTGTDATIPLGTSINAGLISPNNTATINRITATQNINLDNEIAKLANSNIFTNTNRFNNTILLNKSAQFSPSTPAGGLLFAELYHDINNKWNFETTESSNIYSGFDFTGVTSNKHLIFTNSDITWGGVSLLSVGGASNANTLDNLDSTQFLRSDIEDTAHGVINFVAPGGNPIKLKGSGTGNSNTTIISFNSLNDTRHGYIGLRPNYEMVMSNNISDKRLILDMNGDLTYNGGAIISGRADLGGNEVSGDSIICRNSSYSSTSSSGTSSLLFSFANHGGAKIEGFKTSTNTTELKFYTEVGYNTSSEGMRLRASGNLTVKGKIFAEDTKDVIQQLSRNGNTISLTNGGSISIPQQTLSLNGNILSISSGNSITLPSSGGGLTQTSGTKTVTVNATGSYFQNGTSSATMYWTKTEDQIFFTIKTSIFSPGFSGVRSGSINITGLQHSPLRDSPVTIYDGVNPTTLSVSQNAIVNSSPSRLNFNVSVKGDGGTNYGSRTITYDFSGTYITS